MPNNGFAIYFDAFVQHKLQKKIDQNLIDRLEVVLKESVFWQLTFTELGISIKDLKTGSFPNKPQYKNWFSLIK